MEISHQAIGGEEIFTVEQDTRHSQQQRQQRFHDIQGRGVFNVIDYSSAFVYNLGHRAEVIVLQNKVGNVFIDLKEITKNGIDLPTRSQVSYSIKYKQNIKFKFYNLI